MKDEKPAKAPMTVQEFAAMGGKARAEGMTAGERKAIAQGAARARWGPKKTAKKGAKKK